METVANWLNEFFSNPMLINGFFYIIYIIVGVSFISLIASDKWEDNLQFKLIRRADDTFYVKYRFKRFNLFSVYRYVKKKQGEKYVRKIFTLEELVELKPIHSLWDLCVYMVKEPNENEI